MQQTGGERLVGSDKDSAAVTPLSIPRGIGTLLCVVRNAGQADGQTINLKTILNLHTPQ
ncbi:MAG: hypothetical protein ACLFM0_05295 [Spirochaetales bacterium]